MGTTSWLAQPLSDVVAVLCTTDLLSHPMLKRMQVTAWIPLLDVNTHNGCMQLLRGGHLAGKTVRHTAAVGNTW
jgi:ectoine hydroxylase-related dioxygenase (phytanoyl-CoA dioxygenase family)